jgi:hypothetical protein
MVEYFFPYELLNQTHNNEIKMAILYSYQEEGDSIPVILRRSYFFHNQALLYENLIIISNVLPRGNKLSGINISTFESNIVFTFGQVFF